VSQQTVIFQTYFSYIVSRSPSLHDVVSVSFIIITIVFPVVMLTVPRGLQSRLEIIKDPSIPIIIVTI
jgi:hypothetical protein